MKKIILPLVFTMAYAISLSLILECLLSLIGIFFAISLDGLSVIEQYPRFIPFCLGLGIIALAVIIVTFILNLRVSEKNVFTKRLWIMEILLSFVILLPMIMLWDMLFKLLQRTF